MRSRGTEYVLVDTRRCEACRRCVEACREEVLGMISLFFHKHVKVVHPERCRGCLRCVAACEHGATQALRPRSPRRATADGSHPGSTPTLSRQHVATDDRTGHVVSETSRSTSELALARSRLLTCRV
jgi:MinD superfamily P-loop ATPase